MSFRHIENGRRRERKKRYAKGLLDLPASIRAANDSARSNRPDEYLVSGRRRLFFTLGVQSAISRFFGLRMCLKLGKIRSRGATLDGCARGNGCERHRILIDWVMPNAVAWVRARAIGRECVVARRCRRRFGPFLGPIFKGPKKGEGGASVLPNLFVRGGGGVCLLARTNVVGAARCFTSRCVLTSALSSLSFSFLQQQQQQHRTFL